MIEPQTPARGILLMNEYDKFKMYRVPCSCGCGSDITFDVEVDNDGSITAHLYSKTTTDYWYQYLHIDYTESWIVINLKTMVNDWLSRGRVIWNALFRGYVETETYVILDQQQSINFADALNKAVSEFENRYKP